MTWNLMDWTLRRRLEAIARASVAMYPDQPTREKAEHVRKFMLEVGKYPGWRQEFEEKLLKAKDLDYSSDLKKMLWTYDNFAYVTKV